MVMRKVGYQLPSGLAVLVGLALAAWGFADGRTTVMIAGILIVIVGGLRLVLGRA